jgi:hypothetical protein
MDITNFQERFLDAIVKRYERKMDAVDDLCRILNSTRDPVYRRLRGETALTPQEMAILASHYNVSLDRMIFKDSTKLLFSFKPISKKVKNFEEYLTYFTADFDIVRRLPNLHMLVASAEIPVLACAYFPELVGFKLYVWGRSAWDFEYLRDRPFSFDLINEPVRRLIKNVQDHYNQIDSSELLSVSSVDMTLAQIEYLLYSEGFKDPQEALALCDSLSKWVAHIKEMVLAGKKFEVGDTPIERSAKFNLYHNEIFFTTNIVLMRSDLGPAVYFTYNGPNFLRTTDERFCHFTDDWFNHVMSKSNPLSLVSDRIRDWFFRELQKKIERVKQRLSVFIDEME